MIVFFLKEFFGTNYLSHDRDLSFDVFFHENLFKSDWAYPRLNNSDTLIKDKQKWEINERYVNELEEDVENLANVLESLNIKVHRPLNLPYNADEISGFNWKSSPVPALNIRDNTLIIGSEIVSINHNKTPP